MFDAKKWYEEFAQHEVVKEEIQIIVDQEKFDNACQLIGIDKSSMPSEVVRRHLEYQLNTKGHNGIGLSMDACGINQACVTDIFTEYEFELGPQYGPNYRTV